MPYNEVVDITVEYLGPAARRFVDRHIENHLAKQPQKLTGEDLSVLVDWIKVSMAIITDDHNLIDNYVGKLTSLSQKCAATAHH